MTHYITKFLFWFLIACVAFLPSYWSLDERETMILMLAVVAWLFVVFNSKSI